MHIEPHPPMKRPHARRNDRAAAPDAIRGRGTARGSRPPAHRPRNRPGRHAAWPSRYGATCTSAPRAGSTQGGGPHLGAPCRTATFPFTGKVTIRSADTSCGHTRPSAPGKGAGRSHRPAATERAAEPRLRIGAREADGRAPDVEPRLDAREPTPFGDGQGLRDRNAKRTRGAGLKECPTRLRDETHQQSLEGT